MKVKKLLATLGILAILLSCVTLGQTEELYPPRELTATGYDGRVELEWKPPAYGEYLIDYYIIYRDNREIRYDTTEDTSFTDNDVQNGVTYEYWVSAIYEEDYETDLSNSDTATPETVSEPSAPRDLRAFPSDSNVLLTWERPGYYGKRAIRNYRIYRGLSSEDLVPIVTVGTIFEYEDRELENDVTYHYAVSAINEIGEGDLSEVVQTTPSDDITEPGVPGDLRALVGNGIIELYWSEPAYDGGSAVMYYQVERNNSPLAVEPVHCFFTDIDVENGVSYTYRIRAVNRAGIGLPSYEVIETPTAENIPSSPGGLDVEETATGLKLSWEGQDDVDHYNVYRGMSEDKLIFHAEVLNNEFIDHQVRTDTRYYYVVRAIRDNRLSPCSNLVSAKATGEYTPEEENDTDTPYLGIVLGAVLIVTLIAFGYALMTKRPDIFTKKPEDKVHRERDEHDVDMIEEEPEEEDDMIREGMIGRKEDDEWTI